jgi:hypothetical protein
MCYENAMRPNLWQRALALLSHFPAKGRSLQPSSFFQLEWLSGKKVPAIVSMEAAQAVAYSETKGLVIRAGVGWSEREKTCKANGKGVYFKGEGTFWHMFGHNLTYTRVTAGE